MTLETLQAVNFGASKGAPRASAANCGSSWCHGAKAGCQALEDDSDKGVEPKASGVERAGNIPYSCHRQSFKSATYKTGGGYWTRSASIPFWKFVRTYL